MMTVLHQHQIVRELVLHHHLEIRNNNSCNNNKDYHHHTRRPHLHQRQTIASVPSSLPSTNTLNSNSLPRKSSVQSISSSLSWKATSFSPANYTIESHPPSRPSQGASTRIQILYLSLYHTVCKIFNRGRNRWQCRGI